MSDLTGPLDLTLLWPAIPALGLLIWATNVYRLVLRARGGVPDYRARSGMEMWRRRP